MKTVWMIVCSLAASHLFADTNSRSQQGSGNLQPVGFRGRAAGAGGGSSHGSGGFWLERKVMNPEFMKRVGISAEQAKKLKEAWKKIEEQSQKLEEQIHQLARQQADLAKKVLSQPGSDTQELMDLVEKIGTLRIGQAKLAMNRVILIRDHLTPEQRTQLNTILEEDQKKWRAAREEAVRRRENSPVTGPKKPSGVKPSGSAD